jgi:hypothetical protein
MAVRAVSAVRAVPVDKVVTGVREPRLSLQVATVATAVTAEPAATGVPAGQEAPAVRRLEVALPGKMVMVVPVVQGVVLEMLATAAMEALVMSQFLMVVTVAMAVIVVRRDRAARAVRPAETPERLADRDRRAPEPAAVTVVPVAPAGPRQCRVCPVVAVVQVVTRVAMAMVGPEVMVVRACWALSEKTVRT